MSDLPDVDRLFPHPDRRVEGSDPAEPWVLIDGDSYDPAPGSDATPALPLRGGGPRTPRLVKKSGKPRVSLNSQQRLLLLDTWRRSALPAGDFASLVGVSKHTLYAWKKRFDESGPAGLADQLRGPKEGRERKPVGSQG